MTMNRFHRRCQGTVKRLDPLSIIELMTCYRNLKAANKISMKINWLLT